MSKTQTVAKSAVVAKVAPKSAPKAAVKAKAEPAAKSFFVLADIARPVSSGLLFAHTMAALHVLGMIGKDRPAVRTAALQSFTGARAIKYHSVDKGTMEKVGDKIRLTPVGVAFFNSRVSEGKIQKSDFEGFVEIFSKGTVPKDLAIKPNNIVATALVL